MAVAVAVRRGSFDNAGAIWRDLHAHALHLCQSAANESASLLQMSAASVQGYSKDRCAADIQDRRDQQT